jgi:hypothetical protein
MIGPTIQEAPMQHRRPAWRRMSRSFFVGLLFGMLVTSIPVVIVLVVVLGATCQPVAH